MITAYVRVLLYFYSSLKSLDLTLFESYFLIASSDFLGADLGPDSNQILLQSGFLFFHAETCRKD